MKEKFRMIYYNYLNNRSRLYDEVFAYEVRKKEKSCLVIDKRNQKARTTKW